MYPADWGYRQHRAEPYDGPGPRTGTQAVQSALDLRDSGAPRPDDN
jgi:hypothetical protein